ncbi:glycosyltransferase [Niveispirillum cyanobacteriorum]|nr:glycosyltransferase [Niveispirillum cyanobacteriorum]
MHMLIVSPIASHPQFQGNSQRIFRLCRLLQVLGYKIHFLYYTLEGLTPDQRKQMEACWDYLHVVPCRPLDRSMSLGTHYGLDDWYDPQVSDIAAALHARWKYCAVIVNYVWFSGVLESLPVDLIKIIDTHDVFGDRHLRSIAAGMKPEWFYTSQDEELRGLLRADIILAIQDDEKAYFEQLGVPRVEVVGFITPPNFLPPRSYRSKPVIGYIASSNPWNVNSFRSLHAALENSSTAIERFEFFLAGPICDVIRSENRIFDIMGVVDRVDCFYRSVDIVLNPMLGGTGLKIKSIEALSYGRAFLTTTSGMIGIPSQYPQHNIQSISEIVSEIETIDVYSIDKLAFFSREVFCKYTTEQISNFRYLFNEIKIHSDQI